MAEPRMGRPDVWRGPRCRPHPAGTHPVPRDGRRHCGHLEAILVRQWQDGSAAPSPALVQAIDRFADLPAHLADRLADRLRGIWVGPGSVPDLDDLGFLRGVPFDPKRPRLTWDLAAGAFTGGLLAVSSARSASYDVTLHEIGHALDHIDQMSTSDEFSTLHAMVRPVLVDPYYRDQPAELFAEGFALAAAGYATGLVTLMSGNEARAEVLWAYFRRHYLIGRPR